jgi:PadR family transcriptional regulator PadR
MKSWIAQVRKGIVELCVLASLQRGEAYGYQILQRLSGVEGLAITESAIYPILSRLTADAMLTVRTAPSPDGPPRRYYRLTPLGRARLREMIAFWGELQLSVEKLIKEGE